MDSDQSYELTFGRAASGDREAFGVLVRHHQSMVFSLACYFLRDPAAAEDLAQDVFLEFHRALSGIESAGHAVNWLRRVTTHRCIDRARHSRRHETLPLDEAAEPVSGHAIEPDLLLSERIRKLTASLPEKARAVLLLRYQEDLEPAEISRVLGMPVNTVKSHLQRSLSMLREKLERTRVQL